MQRRRLGYYDWKVAVFAEKQPYCAADHAVHGSRGWQDEPVSSSNTR